ncbi:DUF2333 family protein [Halomonas sp. McH1-25]|uniref:DUF2333 family protein n=1 Tax=unclassified Halomonas TaxID=2609666 RepID=UPI001EF59DAC|nr:MULTISPECIES: DUF2333 family protein [unclassified Halomonas]MCG7599118.1 DUF2333 family protein [Halomonas sp. McH1-25]MCP1343586.1 DUF2333 family protein [Halomonas sp. FL8]MCP1361068.1 DUF2333 family protein [Halomonas sp. BBD45]MCP1365512.1 DUF2333 family protein [Halomonas sp. BBD48]
MAMFRNRKRRTEVLERPEYGWIWKPLLVLLVIYLVVCIGLGIWWSLRPDSFDIEQAVVEWQGDGAQAPLPQGVAFSSAVTASVDTLLDKPGGLLRNDVAPPGLWLDNMPSWELGVLRQARLTVPALAAMSNGDGASLADAEAALDTDSEDWIYPSAEKRYAQAVELLHAFTASLSAGNGLTNRGDALAQWLRSEAERFDALTRRLSASIDDPEALRELGVDESELPEATPWYHIDNVFYEARGEAWALMHYLRGLRRDYAPLFEQAGALAGLERMIAELEMALRPLWSPVVLNGSGFGIFANHSLTLANYTAGISDQARRLADGIENTVISTPPASEPPSSPENDDSTDNSPNDAGNGEQMPRDDGQQDEADSQAEDSASTQAGSGNADPASQPAGDALQAPASAPQQ